MANVPKLSHDELVTIAQKWLCAQRCGIVITELASCGEIPDALGWYGYHSTLVECKASREDFKRDLKKHYRQKGASALGCHRYYMAPRGLLCVDEIPGDWGLIVVNENGKARVVKKSNRFETWREGELLIMMSLVRRIGQKPVKGVSIRFYTHENKSTATASISTSLESDVCIPTPAELKDMVEGGNPTTLFKDVTRELMEDREKERLNTKLIEHPQW